MISTLKERSVSKQIILLTEFFGNKWFSIESITIKIKKNMNGLGFSRYIWANLTLLLWMSHMTSEHDSLIHLVVVVSAPSHPC